MLTRRSFTLSALAAMAAKLLPGRPAEAAPMEAFRQDMTVSADPAAVDKAVERVRPTLAGQLDTDRQPIVIASG